MANSHPDVPISEWQPDIRTDVRVFARRCLLSYLKDAQVRVLTHAKVQKIEDDKVTYLDQAGQSVSLPATTVISAFGYRDYNPLEAAARSVCENVQVIGGAVKAGNALTAIAEGYKAALDL